MQLLQRFLTLLFPNLFSLEGLILCYSSVTQEYCNILRQDNHKIPIRFHLLHIQHISVYPRIYDKAGHRNSL